ncbi:hypothetical protein F5I97DRAFT_1955180 [Phlebopus sp. FC_14]|nr:hypothetical protein F5I97DRAFT_1955180 [Phlebopus sp. FC_14]
MRPTFRTTRSHRRATVAKLNCKDQATSVSKENQEDNTSNKKPRHRMSTAQLIRLEEMFRQDTHPSRQRKKDVADELGMQVDYKTVTIWFQNKRQTSKRAHLAEDTHTCSPRNQDVKAKLDRPTWDPSSLRAVSSPVHNATLGMAVDPNDPLSPTKRANITSSKAFNPLLKPLSVLILKAKVSSDSTNDKGVEKANGSRLLKHDKAVTSTNALERTVDGQEPKDGHRRQRTLEWACERRAKRRKPSKDGYSRLADEEPASTSNDRRTDSALSLLSLASSLREEPARDVMRGASLLLSFKHSLHHKICA